MSNYTLDYIKNHKKETKRLLGINYEQLESLIEYAKNIHKKKLEEIETKKIRLIKEGGGKPPKLSAEEQIVLTLVYLRHNLSFQLLGIMFQVSESTANDIFKYWLKILEESLPGSLLEQVKKFDPDLLALKDQLNEYELIVDSEEQNINRPLNYEEPKKYYSGKKKNHTLKNQFIVLPFGEDIVDVVVGCPGPKSDISICRETLKNFRPEQTFLGDKAYIGESQIKTPDKKPRNGELSFEQKTNNKQLSSRRIFVEHLIRLIKIFRVAQEKFRLHKRQYKSVLLTVCGLVRLRIGALILELVKSPVFVSTIEVLLTHSFGQNLKITHNTNE
jgi:hypothetical protein